MFTLKSCGDIGVSRASRTLGGVLAMWSLPSRKEGHRNPRSRPMSPLVSIGVLATVDVEFPLLAGATQLQECAPQLCLHKLALH